MPRRQEPKKDAVSCEKATGNCKQVLIRGYPNGETRPSSWMVTRKEGTWGTETSKYPEEDKSNEMPTVAASEEGRAQTEKPGFSGLRTGRIEVRPS